MGQFQHPLGGYRHIQPILLVRFLTIFLAFWILSPVSSRVRIRHFLMLGLSLVAASYLRAGIGKLLLLWPVYGHVYYLLFTTYGTGWLGFLDAGQIESFGLLMRRFDWLMVAGGVVLEVGILVCFWSRRVAAAFLLLGVVFHVAVFSMSGICFWQWIVLDLALAATLSMSKLKGESQTLFSPRNFALSMVLILGGVIWFRPSALSWLDSPLNYAYRFAAVGESGNERVLPNTFFEPYEYDFTLRFFSTYSEEKMLDVYWGATFSHLEATALANAGTIAAIHALEERYGTVQADATRAAVIDSFVRRWASAWNRRGHSRTAFSLVPAPVQIWSFARPGDFQGDEKIVSVRVHRVKTWFDGDTYREFDDRVVRTIDIPSGSGLVP